MPLDPKAVAMMKMMADAGLGWTPASTPQSMRDSLNNVAANGIVPPHPVHAVEDREVPGPAGAIPVRVYRPSSEPSLPILTWFHGGGWVEGTLDTEDRLCRLLCDDSRAIVVSVDYRLAPENKFPGPLDDCVAAWTWVTQHAAEIGGDASRVAVGGDSAGGNLAAVVALVAREQDLPAPLVQVLVYPITDYEFDSPSMIDNAKGYFLEADEMRWFFEQHASSSADCVDWRMSPMRTPDLAGLPRAVVITAEFDVLRDQGEAYARRLRDAGVPTQLVRGEGLFHGFFSMHAFLPVAREAWDTALGAIREELGTA